MVYSEYSMWDTWDLCFKLGSDVARDEEDSITKYYRRYEKH